MRLIRSDPVSRGGAAFAVAGRRIGWWTRASLAFLALQLLISPVQADTITIASHPIMLDPRDAARTMVGRLEYLGGFELASEAEDWGALSGAVLTPDGSLLTAISDVGLWVRLGLEHDAQERLVGILPTAETMPLLDTNGKPLAGKSAGDAEALVQMSDGSLLVAFEGTRRLWRYGPAEDPRLSRATAVSAPRGIRQTPANMGVEAMTALGGEQLFLLAEGAYNRAGDFRGWLKRPEKWVDVGLIPTDSFKPTDMTVLPNGNVLLLERRVTLFERFAARLSMIHASTITPWARIRSRELAVLRTPMSVDNFEAVAVRQAKDESTLLYLLSDDNQSSLQRTLLLQFRLLPTSRRPQQLP
jgi:hypothetical protein